MVRWMVHAGRSTVPDVDVTAGDLTVRIVADDDGIVVEDQVVVEVLPVPEGEHVPSAIIIEPTVGSERGTGGGKVDVRLRGAGYDLGYGDPQCFNPQSKIATPNRPSHSPRVSADMPGGAGVGGLGSAAMAAV